MCDFLYDLNINKILKFMLVVAKILTFRSSLLIKSKILRTCVLIYDLNISKILEFMLSGSENVNFPIIIIT